MLCLFPTSRRPSEVFLQLSPFEVAADYRAGSVISLWRGFGAGGKEINPPSTRVRTGVGDWQCCPANPSTQGPILLWGCCSDGCSSLESQRKSISKRVLALQVGFQSGKWLWWCNYSAQSPSSSTGSWGSSWTLIFSGSSKERII